MSKAISRCKTISGSPELLLRSLTKYLQGLNLASIPANTVAVRFGLNLGRKEIPDAFLGLIAPALAATGLGNHASDAPEIGAPNVET